MAIIQEIAAISVARAGSGGTPGTATITGTTGTGSFFVGTGTINAQGQLTNIALTDCGAYTSPPTNMLLEPVTGGGLVGATVNISMGHIQNPPGTGAALPAGGTSSTFLRGDATWQTVPPGAAGATGATGPAGTAIANTGIITPSIASAASPALPWALIAPAPLGGGADDQPNLQAAVNALLALSLVNNQKSCTLIIPGGFYTLMSPLLIGDASGNVYTGFIIQGAGRAATTFNAGAANMPSVIQMGGNALGNVLMKDFFITGQHAPGSAYPTIGLWLSNSNCSNLTFENFRIDFAVTAIQMGSATNSLGSNGEFCTFKDFQTHSVTNFYVSYSPQAYGIHFNHGFIYYNLGGALFSLHNPSQGQLPGGGLLVEGVNATPVLTAPGVVSNTILLTVDTAQIAPILFVGGRYEWLTQLIKKSTGNATENGAPITFKGVDFTIDNRVGNSLTTVGSWVQINGTGASSIYVSLEGCNLAPVENDATIYITANAQNGCRSLMAFKGCIMNFTSLPVIGPNIYNTGYPGAPAKAYIVEQCLNNGNYATF